MKAGKEICPTKANMSTYYGDYTWILLFLFPQKVLSSERKCSLLFFQVKADFKKSTTRGCLGE